MTQNAMVTKILPNGKAEIKVKRESACGGNCKMCGGLCSSKNFVKAQAHNSARAVEGDHVVVESSTRGVLTAAFIAYMLPVILFFTFYAISAIMDAAETTRTLMSVGGFLVGIIIAVSANKWYKNKKMATFEIVRVL